MGLSAELIAIGPFARALVPALEHSAERYVHTTPGATVISTVLTAPGTSTSHELARACGVEAWDHKRHALDPEAIDLAAIERLAQTLGSPDAAKALATLIAAGFELYYRPNG